MQQKIIEIIVYMLNEVSDGKKLSEIDISKLNLSGYTDAEINTAFAWIFSKIENGVKLEAAEGVSATSHRFYHISEINAISAEARGYLIQMKELGIITASEQELIINKVFMAGYQSAGMDEIKMIVSSVLFENDSAGLSRLVMQNNETIH